MGDLIFIPLMRMHPFCLKSQFAVELYLKIGSSYVAIAHVSPIHKKESRNLVYNYRAVSLTSKMMESLKGACVYI